MGWRLRPLLYLAAGVVPVLTLGIVYLVLEAVIASRLPSIQALAAVSTARRVAFLLGGGIGVTLMLIGTRALLHGITDWLARVQTAVRTGSGTPAPEPTGIHELDAFAAAVHASSRERDRRTSELLRERDELAFLLEAVNEGILQISADGRLVRANRHARMLLRLGQQIEGQRVGAVVRNRQLREAFERAARGEPVPATELLVDELSLLVAAQPLGGDAGAIAVLVDLTSLRRLEDVRRDFVANASHELKTPLTSIRGYAETLLADDLPPEVQRTFLETIHANAHRLQHILEDLLDLSRIESGGWTPRLQRISVRDAVTDAWEPLRETAEAEGVQIVLDVDDHAAWADPGALRQIFSNLLSNAVRYSPNGGRIMVLARTAAPPAVPVVAGVPAGALHPLSADAEMAASSLPPDSPGLPPRSSANGGRDGAGGAAAGSSARWVALEVRDTGTGIPTAALPRIFERFYRVDAARSRAAGGTGLGLAIVKHLVERMGGDVVAESQLGAGTTIRFRLPTPPDGTPV